MVESAQTRRKGSAKALALLVLVLLVVIVILQNTETVETKLLFVTLNMPRALLLLLNLAIGYALGISTVLFLSRRKSTTAGTTGGSAQS